VKALLFILPLVAALTVAAFVTIAPLEGRGKGDKVANRRVLEELRHPPGTEVTQLVDNPYYRERGPIISKVPVGWTLNVTLRIAQGMTASDVLAFYEHNPPDGWRVSVQDTPHMDLATGRTTGSSRTLIYKQGSAIVSINIDNLGSAATGTYEIGIDHSPNR
jgi:hypothetical protein